MNDDQQRTAISHQDDRAVIARDAQPVVVMSLLLHPEPVFHVRGSFSTTKMDDGTSLSEQRTLCGLLIYRNLWNPQTRERGEHVEKGTPIRRDHATLIGRVCSRCDAAESGGSK